MVRREAIKPAISDGILAVFGSCAVVVAIEAIAARLLEAPVSGFALAVLPCAALVPLFSLALPGARRLNRTASWALLGWAPLLAAGAGLALAATPYGGDVPRLRGLDGFETFVAFAAVFGITLMVGAADERFRPRTASKILAWLGTGAACVLLVMSLARARRPDPRRYIAALPIVGEIRGSADPLEQAYSNDWFSVREKLKGEWGCYLTAAPRDGSLHEIRLGDACYGVVIRRDEGRDLWLFEAKPSVFAINRSTGVTLINPDMMSLASYVGLRPPVSWMLSLAAGCLASLVLLAHAGKIGRRSLAWRSASPAVHRGGGWVVFDARTPPVHYAAAALLMTGPVCVVATGPATGGHYREHGAHDGDVRLAEGPLADILEDTEDQRADVYAYASMLAWVSAAPMLAAAAFGLVG